MHVSKNITVRAKYVTNIYPLQKPSALLKAIEMHTQMIK